MLVVLGVSDMYMLNTSFALTCVDDDYVYITFIYSDLPPWAVIIK